MRQRIFTLLLAALLLLSCTAGATSALPTDRYKETIGKGSLIYLIVYDIKLKPTHFYAFQKDGILYEVFSGQALYDANNNEVLTKTLFPPYVSLLSMKTYADLPDDAKAALKDCLVKQEGGDEVFLVEQLAKAYASLDASLRYTEHAPLVPDVLPAVDPKADPKALQALYPDMESPAVVTLRQRLAKLGYLNTPGTSAVYSTLVIDAVRWFEQVNGLVADGIADLEMVTLLFSDAAKPAR